MPRLLLWGVVFAVIILGEQPGIYALLGTLGIVGGVFSALLAGAGKRAGGAKRGELQFAGTTSFRFPLRCCYATVPVFAKLGLAEHEAPYLGFGVAFGAGPFAHAGGEAHDAGRRGDSGEHAQTLSALVVRASVQRHRRVFDVDGVRGGHGVERIAAEPDDAPVGGPVQFTVSGENRARGA